LSKLRSRFTVLSLMKVMKSSVASRVMAHYLFLSTEQLTLLMGIQQGNDYRGPSATDPSMLAKISSPVLLMQGGRSNVHSWFHAGVSYVIEHVPQATVHEFAELGHLAPMVAPEPIAEKIASFFDNVLQHYPG